MTKKVLPKEIKSWLSLKNYEIFQSLTIEQILLELEFRLMFLIDYTSDDEESNEDWIHTKTRLLEEIIKGTTLSSELSELAFPTFSENTAVRDKNNPEPIEFRVNGIPVISNQHGLRPYQEKLSGDESITPFSMGDLASYYRFYLRHKHIVHGHRISEINDGRIFSCVSAVEDGSSEFEDEVVIKVNLASYTDDELIAEFKELLKEWRFELDIDEPQASKTRVGISTIKKIINYKVFPFLDLMLWEVIDGRKISNDLASRVLFPDDEDEVIGGQQVKDTIRPFVEKILNEDTYQLMKHYVKKNSYLKTMRLSDVMKLSED
ncbi:DUF6387 family protein [Serratia marcescens]|uniref:DUF6387 family protein n=2 Tax=Serratia marcescens TaxID=615 RepID=UPI000D737A1A|nr:DUF6387 family protein [Serratia marcescens]AWO80700.1 hypothetical protein C1N78_20080 [Serratia marcescens]MBH2575860.1 hypothetical protein [Serratia marcescens]MBH2613113.1 hypothetical protein [Serratia marcescens]MBN5331591.1 hypothetical protein [Serratia marcescens]HEJ7282263.1 hypothetical protein [Serratia marcescens]